MTMSCLISLYSLCWSPFFGFIVDHRHHHQYHQQQHITIKGTTHLSSLGILRYVAESGGHESTSKMTRSYDPHGDTETN